MPHCDLGCRLSRRWRNWGDPPSSTRGGCCGYCPYLEAWRTQRGLCARQPCQGRGQQEEGSLGGVHGAPLAMEALCCGCNHEGLPELPPCLPGNGSLGAPSRSPRSQDQPLALPREEHSLGCSLQMWNPRQAQPPVRTLSSEPGAAGLPGIFRKVRLRLLPVPAKCELRPSHGTVIHFSTTRLSASHRLQAPSLPAALSGRSWGRAGTCRGQRHKVSSLLCIGLIQPVCFPSGNLDASFLTASQPHSLNPRVPTPAPPGLRNLAVRG